MGKDDMMLYWGSGSTPCIRVMMTLEEKGFSGYANKQIEFSKKEHKSDEIMALNPRGQVPTFKDGSVVVNESYAIVHYLQHRYGDSGTNLLPGTPEQQALVLQRYYELQANISHNVTNLFYGIMFLKLPEEMSKATAGRLVEQLAIVEQYLAKTPFVAGDAFSHADVELLTALMFIERQSLPMKERYPNIVAYYDRLKTRPSFIASYPPHFKTTDAGKAFAQY